MCALCECPLIVRAQLLELCKSAQHVHTCHVPHLLQCYADNLGVVNLDTGDVIAHDATLYKWLVAYPHEVLPIFDMHVSGDRSF